MGLTGDVWGAVRGFIDTTNVRPARVDSSTWALESIEYEHHEIHAGSHFFHEGYLSLATNAYLDLCIRTENSTKESHFVCDVRSSGGITIGLYENPTVTFTTGTTLTAFNNNRNSSNTSGWQNFVSSAVVSAVIGTGTQLCVFSNGSGGNTTQAIPGAGNRNREIVLKTNSDYVMRLTSLTTATVSYQLEWYEHTPKNDSN